MLSDKFLLILERTMSEENKKDQQPAEDSPEAEKGKTTEETTQSVADPQSISKELSSFFEKPSWLSGTVFIFLATALGYALGFVYEFGYLTYYGISVNFAEVDLSSLVVGVLLATLFGVSFAFNFSVGFIKGQQRAESLNLFEKPLRLYERALLAIGRKIEFYLFRIIPKSVLLMIFVFLFLLLCNFAVGWLGAESKRRYYCFEDSTIGKEKLVLIKKQSSCLLCMKLRDEERGELEPGLVIIPTDGRIIQMKLEKIGPLKVAPVIEKKEQTDTPAVPAPPKPEAD